MRLFITLTVALYLISYCQKIHAQTPEYAKHGMVVSASQLASDAGLDILKKGGNAMDAAVATAFALAVTWPSAGNIGGGGFIVYMDKDGQATTFDFREKAPKAATATMYLDEDGNLIKNLNHDGILAVGVPGTVAGLHKAHAKYGKLPWSVVVKPAIKLARKGFSFTYALHSHSRENESKWKKYPSTARVMYKNDGALYTPGEIWKQPELTATLKRIRKKGSDGFYKGKTAETLVKFIQASGGTMTLDDLAEYEAIERSPVKGTYRGYEIYSMPPPSSGGITLLQMLNILEGYNLQEIGYHSAAYIHLVVEAMRRAYANRAQFLGDPEFNPDMPVEKLLSKEYANSLREQIDVTRASKSDSSLFSKAYESESTTHFSVMDIEGNSVSLTYTLEYSYGSQIVAEGLGFFLNNEMGDFNPVPGLTTSNGLIGTTPNLVAPGKRMLSSMTPTIVAKDGKPVFLVGSPGGRTIINTVLQVILNLVDHQMDIASAVQARRFYHQWLPDMITFEPFCFSSDTQLILDQMGHVLKEYPVGRTQGSVMGIYYDSQLKAFFGSSDPRAPDGGVAGY